MTRSSLPIYVSWTRGVRDWEAELLVAGMRDMLRFAALAPEIKVFGSAAWRDEKEPFSSPDWYQKQSLIHLPGKGTQISAQAIWNKISEEPWRKAENHLDFMIFDKDLNTQILNERTGKYEWINFIFGEGGPLGTIISVYRFRQAISNQAWYRSVLKHIGNHEFGHVLGLVHRQTKTADSRPGLYGGHCLNLCALRQSLSVSEALDLTLRLERAKITLCRDCQEELKLH